MKFKNIHCLSCATLSALALLATDASAQNIFVANWYAPGAIYEFTPNGSQTNFQSGGLGEPEDMAFDAAGNLFVADSLDGVIVEITPDGTETAFVSVDDPHGVAFDAAGNLYVSSYSDGNIYKFAPDGSETTFATGFSNPTGMAFDKAGDLFLDESSSGDIYEFQNKGKELSTTPVVFVSGLTNPQDMAFNKAGDLFVGDSSVGTGDIMIITPGGSKSVFATVPAGGLAFDHDGDLFVASGTTGLIEITPQGTETLFATGLGNATGIAIQGQDIIPRKK